MQSFITINRLSYDVDSFVTNVWILLINAGIL